MSAPELSKHLQLSVTNLGPIARADIELRPMTVFVGPSNTGKSYLAILIYALHRFFNGTALHSDLHRQFFRDHTVFSFAQERLKGKEVALGDVEPVIAWLEKALSEPSTGHSQKSVDFMLPDYAAKHVRPRLEGVGDLCQELEDEIGRCFGVEDIWGLVRNHISRGMRVEVNRLDEDVPRLTEAFGYSLTVKRVDREFVPCIPACAPLRLQAGKEWMTETAEVLGSLRSQMESMGGKSANVSAVIAGAALRMLSQAVGNGIVSPLHSAAHYLPADRTGVMHAHRVVVGSLIGQAARAGFARDVPLPRLSGVLADFLQQLVELDTPKLSTMPKHSTPPSEPIAKHLEDEILQGEIRTARSPVGYPEFLYRPEGWKEDLSLLNTSSMVSELAPVVLYLRYVVRPGETLIIEEPESHLHPALQVEFTRQLAAVALSGVRVIITTHSEWVLEELANLVRLSELPKSRRKGIGSAPYALGRDQLGVWRFEPKKRPKGSVVREIPFNPDIGNFDSGFDRVAMATYNDQAEIIRREERLKTNAGHH
jgi:hypothetical protein